MLSSGEIGEGLFADSGEVSLATEKSLVAFNEALEGVFGGDAGVVRVGHGTKINEAADSHGGTRVRQTTGLDFWHSCEWKDRQSVLTVQCDRPSEEATMESPSSAPFTYDLNISGDTTTVRCHGRIVAETAPELRELVKPMIPKCRRIVLDFTDVGHLDSIGLGTLVGLKISAASAAYCSLELHNLSPHVKELFGLTKLNQVFGT